MASKKYVIRFHIVPSSDFRKIPRYKSYPVVRLISDDWNDYGVTCQFHVVIYESPKKPPIQLGDVKILALNEVGDVARFTSSELPEWFLFIGQSGVSLGQSPEYYRKLARMTVKFRSLYLRAMRDLVYLEEMPIEFEGKKEIDEVLLRFSDAAVALRQGKKLLLRGKVSSKALSLEAELTPIGMERSTTLTIGYDDFSLMPGRIAALVGPNGSGKTQLLSLLASLLAGLRTPNRKHAKFVGARPEFRRTLAISFSAFDKFSIPTNEAASKLGYRYIGIRERNQRVADPVNFDKYIAESIVSIKKQKKLPALVKVLESTLGKKLANDLLAERKGSGVWKGLSAGQRLVTRTLIEITEHSRQNSIILFDEPETHLHPGLLTSLLIGLGYLLEQFDSYLLVATHSPILIQNIPSSLVVKLRNTGYRVIAESPSIETFGASVEDIIRDVLEYHGHEQDYHHVVDQMVEELGISRVITEFGDKISLQLRVYIESLSKSVDQ